MTTTEKKLYSEDEKTEATAAFRLITDRFRAEREAASGELVEAVMHAAKAAGVHVGFVDGREGFTVDGPGGRGAVRLVVRQDWEYGVALSASRVGDDGVLTVEQPPIIFNVERGCFVGKERDGRVVPTPGGRYPQRSAVAVVAERIIEVLTK